jgi:hypothetical protein
LIILLYFKYFFGKLPLICTLQDHSIIFHHEIEHAQQLAELGLGPLHFQKQLDGAHSFAMQVCELSRLHLQPLHIRQRLFALLT